MKQFKYTSQQEMVPRPGVRYATTYTRFTGRERKRLELHLYRVLVEMITNNSDEILNTPLPGFPKTGKKPNYSCWEVVSDLYNQMVYEHKDMPSGMVGRWNRLADALQEDWGIDSERYSSEQQLSRPQYNQLFETIST
tara:strand:+ start:1185 stop:1598 length:414 start_codon:yes stop_codon:yes gene_type:complete